MKTIGITGNIGCGKSTVVEMLSNYDDIIVINSDNVAKDIISSGKYNEQIGLILGNKVFKNEKVDFSLIAECIFNDFRKKSSFENFIHPLVWDYIYEKINSYHDKKICVIESALIFEANSNSKFDYIVTVTCDYDKQIRRLKDSRGMNDLQIKNRISMQFPSSYKEERSNYVIHTDCTLDDLKMKVGVLYKELIGLNSNKKIAIYAASLDPITNGHLNLIERSSGLYDELIVLVANNSKKNYTFSLDERIAIAKESVSHIENVSINVCADGYLVKQAKFLGAQAIIRGIRNVKDLEEELVLAEENRKICPSIETVWLPCIPELSHVSSSMVKGHVGIDPDWEKQISRSVPAATSIALNNKYIFNKAKKHWLSLLNQLKISDDLNSIFEDMVSMYSESFRSYHGLEHIVTMLDESEKINENNPALLFAIWFHDVVYNPRMNNNEEESVKYAKKIIKKMQLPESFENEVCDLIMETKHTGTSLNYLSKILVDLDLVIFGKQSETFDKYETGVRSEYQFVPDEIYHEKRVKIIDSFLNRESIYQTDYFKREYEYMARVNLNNLINKLT